MAFVRNEIREDVPNIKGKIAPGIRRTARDRASVLATQLQEASHPPAALVERLYELSPAYSAAIDGFRHFDSVLLPQRFDPHATRVVDVAGDHSNCPTRRTGHCGPQESRGKMLDEIDGDSIVRSPYGNESIRQVETRIHHVAFFS